MDLNTAVAALEQALAQRDLRLQALQLGIAKAKARMTSLQVWGMLALGGAVVFACLWLHERARHRDDRRERP